MNVLIVSPSFAPYSGVGSIRMISFSKYLLQLGHKVIVIKNHPSSWPSDSLKSEIPEGITTFDIEESYGFKAYQKNYYNMICKIMKEYTIDISVYSCSPYYIAPVAAKIKREFGAKFIIEFRDLWIKDEFITRNLLKRLKKMLYRLPFGKWKKELFLLLSGLFQ